MANVSITSVKNQLFTSVDVDNAVERAIDSLNYDFGGVKTVMIKPNLCYYWNASTGETTDGRVVCSVIKYVKKKLGEDVKITVAEADASAMRTKYAFSIGTFVRFRLYVWCRWRGQFKTIYTFKNIFI